MSAAVMTERIPDVSPRFKSRLAGFFWLLTVPTGTFALLAGGRLIVAGNPAATAANLIAQETLFRASIVSDLVATMAYIAATLIVYELLRPVNRTVSLLAAFLSIMGCGSAALGLALRLASMSLLSRGQSPETALAFLSVRDGAANIAFAFFGLHCVLVGALIFKSTFLPRAIGVLMIGSGLAWMTGSFSNLLLPPLGATLAPYLIGPGALGECVMSLWLLTVGVNGETWNELAGE